MAKMVGFCCDDAKMAAVNAPGGKTKNPGPFMFRLAGRNAVSVGERDADGSSAEDEKQQLEIKVQELEALVEFKDAAIEELEKQYNKLEAKYHALSGAK